MFHRHPGGKGDRPILPKDQEQFDNNWDNIFKKKKVTVEEVDHGVYIVEVTPDEKKPAD